MSDADLQRLLVQVAEGDQAAFGRVYEELKTPVFTILYRITMDWGLAEDLMQELFVRLYRKPPDPGVAKPRAYVFQMARNLAIDGLEKRRADREVGWEDETGWMTGRPLWGAPGPLECCQTRLDLEQAFRTLTATERALVVLHVNGGLKFRELARLLDMPLGTVLWKYQQSLRKLREALEGGIR